MGHSKPMKKTTLNHQPINGKTQLYGVIGHPIEHSLSPIIQNAALAHYDMNGVYLPLLVNTDTLESAIHGIKALNLQGINVTVPFKELVIPYLDDLAPNAQALGAVNTIVNDNQRLIGHNTDGEGFLISLTQDGHTDVTNKAICIIGAGGSARAILHTLLKEKPKSLSLVNRSPKNAQRIANNYETDIQVLELASQDLGKHLESQDIIIQTTPIGMGDTKTSSPITDFSWVKPQQICYDIIYNPSLTPFLKESKARGASIIGGIGMLVGQGALAFQLFTKKAPPYAIMKEKVESYYVN